MALASLFFLFLFFLSTYSQIISTSPVPPLQWINLTSRLSGTSKPPPLKDAFISYDQTTRKVLVFGGVSPSGVLSAETYILDMDSLSWSKPSPPLNLQRAPSARSSVGSISGPDVAANSRNAFFLYGGTDASGKKLTDVWEYDFVNQFWSQLQTTSGGPSGTSSAGGVDRRSQPFTDPSHGGLVNTFYLLASDSSDTVLWRFNTSGTLSSNLPDSAQGVWDRTDLTNVPAFNDEASSAVIGSKVTVLGGCTKPSNDSCAFVVELDGSGQPSVINVPACAAPREGARAVANLNGFESGFSSQVFLLLGTLEANWDDNNGLSRGEIAVLDTNAGTWSRVIPSGDPSGSGQPAVPVPRNGAAIAAMGITATTRTSTDTIIFGGQDGSGQYLNDVWLLRAYPGTATPSSPRWSGFGDGNLESGIDASGAGVEMQFMSQCASLSPTPTTQPPSSSSTSVPTSQPTETSTPSRSTEAFDTAIHHKVLSPLSVAVALFPLLLLRFVPQAPEKYVPERRMALTYTAGFILFGAYALGLAGLATSFTSLSTPTTSTALRKRASSSSSAFLQTVHGKVGLAFFALLYIVVPLLFLSVYLRQRFAGSRSSTTDSRMAVPLSEDKSSNAFTPSHSPSPPPSSPRMRSQSIGPSSSAYRPSQDRSDENDALSMSSSGAQRTFQVLNRPSRTRRHSSSWLDVPMQDAPRHASRSLSDIDWLQRRRRVAAVGELDYAISQAIRAQEAPPTPGTMDALMGPFDPRENTTNSPKLPPTILEMASRILLQISICGLCVISLIALWTRASKALFAVFLAWTLLYYLVLFVASWNGRPATSILTVVLSLLRPRSQTPTATHLHERSSNTATPTPLAAAPGYPFPTSGSSSANPYIHHNPLHHTAPSTLGHDDMFSYTSPRSVETPDNDDDDEDEYTRQQRIEGEMERREVSIVTVPKRKLWVANPS